MELFDERLLSEPEPEQAVNSIKAQHKNEAKDGYMK